MRTSVSFEYISDSKCKVTLCLNNEEASVVGGISNPLSIADSLNDIVSEIIPMFPDTQQIKFGIAAMEGLRDTYKKELDKEEESKEDATT